MTEIQIVMARHALGLGWKHKVSNRNNYIIGPGCTNYEAWLEMVESGDALRFPASKEVGCGNNDLFQLTRQGAEKVLQPGEKLDGERFPVQIPIKSGLREQSA